MYLMGFWHDKISKINSPILAQINLLLLGDEKKKKIEELY